MRKVLIMLDTEDLRLALRDALQSKYTVIDCCNVQMGLSLIRELPDALVLDLLMREMDGLTFLQAAREHRPPVVLMLTTLLSADILQLAAELGVDYMIRKPCSVSAVCDCLAECLE